MSRAKLLRSVLIASSALILIGIALMTWMLATEEDRNNIEVVLSDKKTQVVHFDNLALIPGGECEYYVVLKSNNTKTYELSLDFVELGDEALKDFARVKIYSDDGLICDELLATVFSEEPIVIPVDFNTSMNTELTIVYYLPLDVGNEAKKAEAVFELRLTASNERGNYEYGD